MYPVTAIDNSNTCIFSQNIILTHLSFPRCQIFCSRIPSNGLGLMASILLSLSVSTFTFTGATLHLFKLFKTVPKKRQLAYWRQYWYYNTVICLVLVVFFIHFCFACFLLLIFIDLTQLNYYYFLIIEFLFIFQSPSSRLHPSYFPTFHDKNLVIFM